MKYMKRGEVLERTTLSATTLWREVKAGRFPRPHKLASRRVAWLESEVEAWVAKNGGAQ